MLSQRFKGRSIIRSAMAVVGSLALAGMLAGPVQAAQETKGGQDTPLAPVAPVAPLANTDRVSLSDSEAQGNGASGIEGIPTGVSADGRFVAFYSAASNLVAGDTNGYADIFLRDRQEGTTTLVSRSYTGGPANGISRYPSISDDGTYVAFQSSATNLAPFDDNDVDDIFIYNTQTGSTTMIVLAGHTFGTEDPRISGDGQFVAFHTYASLSPDDDNGTRDVYVLDLVTPSVELISSPGEGMVGNGHSFTPYISHDGRFVAFHSLSDNLAVMDINGVLDVFVKDRELGGLVMASVTSAGAQGNQRSYNGVVSDDGRYVAFESLASNLATGDTNGSIDIFVRDVAAGTTTRASVSSSGAQGTGHSTEPHISGDGRYVAFQSGAILAPTDPSILTDIYLRDLQSSTTEQISMSSSAQPGNSYSHKPHLSRDGRYVVFGSYASNLVGDDTNEHRDVFLRDRVAACTVAFTDVQPGSTFHPYVQCLACRGIVGGYSDGTYRPNNPVTRGQLSKVVANAAGYTETYTTQAFADVPVGSTFHPYIERLYSRGIIGGYACGGPGEPCDAQNRPYFRPGNNVTRGQTSKIVAISANLPAPPSGQHTFEDVAPGSTFWAWVEALAGTGAINGYACGSPGEPCVPPNNRPYFRPGNDVTRGQSAKVVANTFFPDCQP